MEKEYFEMLKKYETGQISDQEWSLYCMATLKDLMFLHQDVLKNLKQGLTKTIFCAIIDLSNKGKVNRMEMLLLGMLIMYLITGIILWIDGFSTDWIMWLFCWWMVIFYLPIIIKKRLTKRQFHVIIDLSNEREVLIMKNKVAELFGIMIHNKEAEEFFKDGWNALYNDLMANPLKSVSDGEVDEKSFLNTVCAMALLDWYTREDY